VSIDEWIKKMWYICYIYKIYLLGSEGAGRRGRE
jgi:hypothetical protein